MDELKAICLVSVYAVLLSFVLPAIEHYEENWVLDEFNRRTIENFPGYTGRSVAGKSGEAPGGYGPIRRTAIEDN